MINNFITMGLFMMLVFSKGNEPAFIMQVNLPFFGMYNGDFLNMSQRTMTRCDIMGEIRLKPVNNGLS
jgi:hypothetical protein